MPTFRAAALFRRAVDGLALVLFMTEAAPAHALETTSPAPSAAPHAASAQRLLRDPEALVAWLGKQSPYVAAARARANQAQADVRTTHLLPNPVLDGSMSNVALSSGHGGLGDTAIFGVGLSQTFELGKRGPRQDAAALLHRAAQLEVTSTLNDRVAAAREALAAAVHLGLRVTILRESLSDAQRATELERTRLEQKALSGMDYDRLLLDLAALRSEVARTESEYTAALAECRATLSADCDVTAVTEDDLGEGVPATVLSGAEDRLAARPDVRSLDFQASAARREADLAANRAIPDVTARVGYVHDRFVASGDIMNTLNFGLALPITIFDRGQHEAHKASEHALELEDSKRALLADARADLEGLLSRKAALESNLDVLTKDTLPRSNAVLTAAEQAFHQGGASMTDFLLARRTHIALSLTRLDQHFELFEVKNELYRVLGLVGPGTQGNQ